MPPVDQNLEIFRTCDGKCNLFSTFIDKFFPPILPKISTHKNCLSRTLGQMFHFSTHSAFAFSHINLKLWKNSSSRNANPIQLKLQNPQFHSANWISRFPTILLNQHASIITNIALINENINRTVSRDKLPLFLPALVYSYWYTLVYTHSNRTLQLDLWIEGFQFFFHLWNANTT